MNAKHRSSSLVTHLFLRLHQPEAKYHNSGKRIATIAINVVGHGSGPLGTPTVRQTVGDPVTLAAGWRGSDQNGDGVIGDNEGHLAAAPRILSDRSDGTRQTVVDLMELVHPH
jgi:hypothetical protein